jgi:hypothetical protein
MKGARLLRQKKKDVGRKWDPIINVGLGGHQMYIFKKKIKIDFYKWMLILVCLYIIG